jgi:hypothetical protein
MHSNTPRSILKDSVNQLLGFAEKFKDTTLKSQVSRLLTELDQHRPQVIVYGQYNSGKSTLINALLSEAGETLAAVADRPLTDHSHRYTYQNNDLIDTPGIHAPIDHEQIAKETLIASHAILFVVSTSGNFDEEKVIDELNLIVKSGRPTIVVINDKDGYLAQGDQDQGLPAEGLAQIQQKIARSIKMTAETGSLHYVTVNAQRGWEAKKYRAQGQVKAEQIFWEQSGLINLKETLDHILLTFGEREMLLPTWKTFLSLADNIIAKGMNDLSSEDLKRLHDEREDRLTSISTCEQEGIRLIRGQSAQLNASLEKCLDNKGMNQKVALQGYIESIQKIMADCLSTHIPQIYQSLEINTSKALDLMVHQTQELAPYNGSDTQQDIETTIAELLTNGPSTIMIQEALKNLPVILGPVITKTTQQTLTTLLGTLARGVGPLLALGALFFQYRSMQKAEEERFRRSEEQARQRHNALQTGAEQIERELVKSWKEVLQGATELSIKVVDEQIEKLTVSDNILKDSISELSRTREQVHTLNLSKP